MTAYFIPKEPTKRTIVKRIERLEKKRDYKIYRKVFIGKEFEWKGYIIKRPLRQRWEVWKDGVLLQWFITMHETRSFIKWRMKKDDNRLRPQASNPPRN